MSDVQQPTFTQEEVKQLITDVVKSETAAQFNSQSQGTTSSIQVVPVQSDSKFKYVLIAVVAIGLYFYMKGRK